MMNKLNSSRLIKCLYYFIVVILIFLCGFFISNSNVFADNSSSNSTNRSSSNEEVNLTVPSEIKITLNSDGTNTVPSNYTVTNDTIYKINLDNVEMTGANNWKLLNSNVDVKIIKKDTKKVKFYVNDTLIQPKNSSNAILDESSNGSSSIVLDEDKNQTINAYSSSKIKFNIERGAYSKDISTEKAFDMVLNFNIQDLSNTLNTGEIINSLIPDDTTRVEFVTENPGNPKDLNFELIDLSAKQDMGIVGWTESITNSDGTIDKVFKISSRRNNKKNVFNSNSARMFQQKSKIEYIHFNDAIDTSNVGFMFQFFRLCNNLKEIDVSSWDTSKMTNMDGVFDSCKQLKTIDVSNWNTKCVTQFAGMFWNCTNLEQIIGLDKLYFYNNTTAHVMFKDCNNVKELDLSTFYTKKLTTHSGVFANMYKLEKVIIGNDVNFDELDNNYLPTPSSDYIDSADGYWYDIETNKRYLSSEIPSNHAATYVAKRNTITYEDLGDATNSSNNPTYAANGLSKDLTIEPVTTNKTGYTFDGWTVKSKINNWYKGDLNSKGEIINSTRGAYYSDKMPVKAGITYSWNARYNEDTNSYLDGARYYENNNEIGTIITGSNNSFTPNKDGYIRFLISNYTSELGKQFEFCTVTKQKSFTLQKEVLTGNITLIANWTPRNDTKYTVNYYLMNKDGFGYDLNKTDVKQGITDSSLEFSSLKENFENFTYKGIKLNNNNSYIDENVYNSTYIMANGSRVINIYYDRNKIFFDLNGYVDGQLSGKLGTYDTSNYKMIRTYGKCDVYINGSKVLDQVNDSDYYYTYYGSTIEIKNINAMPGVRYDGVYKQNDDAATSLKFVLTKTNTKICLKFDTIQYDINYDVNGGNQISTVTNYNVLTNDISIPNPTRTGYVFKGWTKEIRPTQWYDGFISFDDGSIDVGSTGTKYEANTQYSEYIKVEKGKHYEIPLAQSSFDSFRIRAYNNNLNYIGTEGENKEGVVLGYNPTEDGYVRILNLNKEAINSEDLYLIEKDNSTSKINEGCLKDDVISSGSTGNIKYTANWFSLASKTESQVGKYADVDGDGIVDGIIFADLLFGRSGEWNPGNSSIAENNKQGAYSIPTITSCKDYYISQKSYNNKLGGTNEVLTPIGNENERFYVMSLSNISLEKYDWYNDACGKINNYNIITNQEFGKGKSNTLTMITNWNSKIYGEKNLCSEHKDIWEDIQKDVNDGWFVPSSAEWSAFANNLGITHTNYSSKGLSYFYWSSTLYNASKGYDAYFNGGYIGNGNNINIGLYIRLATTF